MTSEPTNPTGFALGLETSGPLGSAAIGRGPDILATRALAEPMAHAREFAQTLRDLCREHGAAPDDIRQVYVSIGPGSFTGIRIGITTARMIALAVGARLVAVPSLDAIAVNALDLSNPPASLAVILDAKRRRVYGATFDLRAGRYIRTADPAECDPVNLFSAVPGSHVANAGGRLAPARDDQAPGARRATASAGGPVGGNGGVTGPGIPRHETAVRASGLRVLPESVWHPRAESVYHLGYQLACAGRLTEPRNLLPVYIRLPEAEEKWRLRHGEDQRQPGCS